MRRNIDIIGLKIRNNIHMLPHYPRFATEHIDAEKNYLSITDKTNFS